MVLSLFTAMAEKFGLEASRQSWQFLKSRNLGNYLMEETMKTHLDCIPCIVRQSLTTARLSTDDEEIQHQVIDKVMQELHSVSLDRSPADNSNIAYRITEEMTGVNDPYYSLKKEYNQIALSIYPDLKEELDRSDDRLKTALKLAIVGNIIDFGIEHQFDLEKDMRRILETEFAVDDYDDFKAKLDSAKRILYLGDNAGEIVFDKLLVEELNSLGKELTFVVKSGPVINDALMEDASEVEMDKIAKIIETGSNGIGVYWDKVSDEFVRAFKNADLTISKGQGNFETMDEREEEIFFLLMAKCDCTAKELGVNRYDIVLASNRPGLMIVD